MVSVSVESNRQILQYLHQMFTVSVFLLDNALLKFYKFSRDSDSEKSLESGQYLIKLWGIQKVPNFLATL